MCQSIKHLRLLCSLKPNSNSSGSRFFMHRLSSSSTAIKSSDDKIIPQSDRITDIQVDKKTHTGQEWDDRDHRLARFAVAPKQVNPNFAINLIAEVPPTPCNENVVSCDGGGGALGHPKIYLNLDKPGNHACGYCGLRFYKEGQEHDGSEYIQV